MGVLLLIVYLTLITPVKLGAAVSVGSGPPQAAVGVMIGGWKRVAHMRVRRQDGVPRLCAEIRGRRVILSRRSRTGWTGQAARTLLRVLTDRKRSGRGLHLVTLDGFIQIGGQDAAATALLTGGLRAALACFPSARVRCFPAFGGQTVLRLRCIAQARLGTILAAGLMTALETHRQGRTEEGAWIIPSGN